jgi:hypothetical protein
MHMRIETRAYDEKQEGQLAPSSSVRNLKSFQQYDHLVGIQYSVIDSYSDMRNGQRDYKIQ